MGGENFTRDIVVGLRTTISEAERIKCRFGSLDTQSTDPSECLEMQGAGSGKPRQVIRQILTDIIQPRTEEIFEMIRTELNMAGFELSQFTTVVLSGGGAMLDGLTSQVERMYRHPLPPG